MVRSAAWLLLLVLLAGCVERRLFVRTEPPGARIRINGREAGTSPATWTFDHYGTVLVEAELDGHRPAERAHPLKRPWYQLPVLDFFADVLVPFRICDDHELVLRLEPLEPPREEETEELARAARELRERAQRR